MRIQSAGELMNLPDEAGVYVIVCTFMGETDVRLGEILYIGFSDSIRRRAAYALASPGTSAPHGVQTHLLDFQRAGGAAQLLYCVLNDAELVRRMEDALLAEFRYRRGALPRWNRRGAGRVAPTADIQALAAEILDRLNVMRKSP
jgi:hypothetical protein